MTSSIITLAGSWTCASHNQSLIFISLYICWLFQSPRYHGSTLRCAWNVGCVKKNWVELKKSMKYNVRKICIYSLIKLLLLYPKSRLERSIQTASAYWYDLILKWSSTCLKWWSIHNLVCWLKHQISAQWYADLYGYHQFHCCEYMWWLLYHPVAFPFGFCATLSTPTPWLWAPILSGSGVHVRSGVWESVVSASGVRVHHIRCPSEEYLLTGFLKAIPVHLLKSNHDG